MQKIAIIAMMRTLLPVLLLTVLLFMLSTACVPDRVASDLLAYVNQGILHIAELEQRALGRYAELATAPDASIEKRLEVLQTEVIPTYALFLDRLGDLRPQTDDVRRLHEIFVHGAEMIDRGLKAKRLGLLSRSDDVQRSADALIRQGQMETLRWRRALLALNQSRHIVSVEGRSSHGRGLLKLFEPK